MRQNIHYRKYKNNGSKKSKTDYRWDASSSI